MTKHSVNRSLINFMCSLYGKDSVSSRLEIDEIKEPHSTILFLRDNYGLRRTGAHGNEVPVIELKNGFSLYASITYKHIPRKDDLLDGVSLQFFYGMLLLFRA